MRYAVSSASSEYRSPVRWRLHQDFIDELDDRRLLSLLGDFAVVGLEFFEQLDLVLGAFLHHGIDGFAADAEVRLDEPRDLARTGEDGMHMQTGKCLQFIDRVNVERIAGRNDQGTIGARQRHQVAAMHELDRHDPERIGIDARVREIDEVHAELIGENGENIFLLGKVPLDDDGVQRFVRR